MYLRKKICFQYLTRNFFFQKIFIEKLTFGFFLNKFLHYIKLPIKLPKIPSPFHLAIFHFAYPFYFSPYRRLRQPTNIDLLGIAKNTRISSQPNLQLVYRTVLPEPSNYQYQRLQRAGRHSPKLINQRRPHKIPAYLSMPKTTTASRQKMAKPIRPQPYCSLRELTETRPTRRPENTTNFIPFIRNFAA